MIRVRYFFVFLLFPLCSFAQESTEQPLTFDEFTKSSFEKFELPSMAVSIFKDDKEIYAGAFGRKGNDDPTTPDNQTLYAIASLSKAFTAASIGMLVDEGKLEWDDQVIEHLPWFKMHDSYVTEHMTIEDLLCHRSGLITFDCDLLWYGSNYNREEAIKRIHHRPANYEFRTDFGYQNLMFMTAGEVIEAVSGKTWDAFVKERILDPLEMNRTTSSFNAFSQDDNIARPHLEGDEIFMLSYDNSGATAALNSCTSDMSKWLSFWLAQGITGTDTLLQPATINKIWSLHTPLGVSNFDQRNGTHFKGYGLGWFLMDYNGRKVIHHGGGLPGYITKAVIVPEENLSVVVLTNDMSSVPTMMMYAAIDWAMEKDFNEWDDTFYDFKQRGAKREAEQKAERLTTKEEAPIVFPQADYVGVYEDEMYGTATIKEVDGELIISLDPAQELFTGKMEPWSKHAFRFDHNDPFLTYGIANFDVRKDVIHGFTIDLPNYDFHFDKLYFKRQE